MQTDILIIGQGISGTFLSHWLKKEGISYILLDEEQPFSPSRMAAGIINPVTGRRIVKTWMIDELLPFAQHAYQKMNEELGISCLSRTEIIDFFPTVQMRNAFVDRYETFVKSKSLRISPTGKINLDDQKSGSAFPEETRDGAGTQDGAAYLEMPQAENAWIPWFHYELGFGRIDPCFLIDLDSLLTAARKKLTEEGHLLEERFDHAGLRLNGKAGPGIRSGYPAVSYKDIQAGGIVFCDGAGSFDNPYFRNLPFAPNKGEVLIVEIKGLPPGNPIFKKGMVLAPWREGLYWLGSSYEWSFENDQPTAAFRNRAIAVLQEWLKLPFRVVNHFASVRPATLERRPFVGFHPLYGQVGILNGMGTKGCTLAPFFARQLTNHLMTGQPIQPDADVKRFTKILGR